MLGIPSAPRYIQKPAFRTRVFAERRTFGQSQWPFTLARPEALDWRDERFPGTLDFLGRVLVLPWNENYTEDDVTRIASALISVLHRLVEAAA